MVVAFTLNWAKAGMSCSETDLDVPPVVAVSLTDWVVDTAIAFAVKAAVVAVAGMVTEPGTVRFVLLLASATVKPPFGAEPDKLTLHESARDPVIDVVAQDSALIVGAAFVPVPLRATVSAATSLKMLNCPLTDAVVEGLNWTVNTIAWPGFSVAGKLPPDTEKPVPVIVFDFMVTGAVPVDVKVTDLLTAVPTETLPKASEDVLRLRAAADGFNWSAMLFEDAFAVAEMVAVCALLTAATFAVNDAVVEPAGTVMAPGAVTAVLLLARAMVTPPLGAEPDKLTLHESARDPVIDVVAQDSALIVGAAFVPVPLRATVSAATSLKMLNWPLTDAVVEGLNWTVNTIAWPGFSVAGKLPPDIENPVPVIAFDFIVTGTVPVDVKITDLVAAVPTETLPKASEDVLRLRLAADGFSWSAMLFEDAFAVAEMVAACALVTAVTFAVNEAVLEPAGTVMAPGAVTAPLLLARAMLTPPLGAEPDRLTVHGSDRDPVMDVVLHDNALMVGAGFVPVPLRPSVAVPALLETVNWPLTEPAAEGPNRRVRIIPFPGSNVAGKLPPDTENPLPVIVSDLIVTGAEPLDVRVTDFWADVPTSIFPNCIAEVLRLRPAADALDAFNWIARLFDEEFAVAEMATLWALLTAATFAAKEAVVEWAATVTLSGTVIAVLLLASAMITAFDEAALNATVHMVFPAAENEVFAQDRASNAGGGATAPDDESEIEKDFSMLPCVAVIVPLWSVLNVATVAANFTLVAPSGTVTDAGTFMAAMLLERRTRSPPDGAELFVRIVQVSLPTAVISAVSQLKALISAFWADPLPCRGTVAAGVVEALVITFNWPVASVLSFGWNWTLKLSVLPTARVAGSLPSPSTRKAAFERDNCEIWTESDPLFVTETFWLAEFPGLTDPNSIEEGAAERFTSFVAGREDPPRVTTPPHPETPKLERQSATSVSGTKRLALEFLQKVNDCSAKIWRPKVGRISIPYIFDFSRAGSWMWSAMFAKEEVKQRGKANCFWAAWAQADCDPVRSQNSAMRDQCPSCFVEVLWCQRRDTRSSQCARRKAWKFTDENRASPIKIWALLTCTPACKRRAKVGRLTAQLFVLAFCSACDPFGIDLLANAEFYKVNIPT
jgi:hypothetical protein